MESTLGKTGSSFALRSKPPPATTSEKLKTGNGNRKEGGEEETGARVLLVRLDVPDLAAVGTLPGCARDGLARHTRGVGGRRCAAVLELLVLLPLESPLLVLLEASQLGLDPAAQLAP